MKLKNVFIMLFKKKLYEIIFICIRAMRFLIKLRLLSYLSNLDNIA